MAAVKEAVAAATARTTAQAAAQSFIKRKMVADEVTAVPAEVTPVRQELEEPSADAAVS